MRPGGFFLEPLISVSGLTDPNQFTEQKKVAAALALAALAARVSPTLARPVARYGLGVELGAAGEVIGVTPLVGTNLLPQPLGFAPPSVFGLEPDFYLPSGAYRVLPDIVPGVAAQRAKAPRPSSTIAPDRPPVNEFFRFRPLRPGEDRYARDVSDPGTEPPAVVPPVVSVGPVLPGGNNEVATQGTTAADRERAAAFAEAALRYSTQPVAAIESKLKAVAQTIQNPPEGFSAPYFEGFYAGLIDALNVSTANTANGFPGRVPTQPVAPVGTPQPPPIIGSGGTGTAGPVGPGGNYPPGTQLPAPGSPTAPGNTPGQGSYGNPGRLNSGNFPDGFFAKKHGDP